MKNLSEEVNEIKELLNNFSACLDSDKVTEKEVLDYIFNLFGHCFLILNHYDQKKLLQLKERELTTFLRFIPYMRKFLENSHDYTVSIQESLSSDYTSDLSEEIETLTKKLSDLIKKLDTVSADTATIVQAEELEAEYQKVGLLLIEKEKLKKTSAMLNTINIQELTNETETLASEVKQAEQKLFPLNKEKEQLSVQLEQYQQLAKAIETLKAGREHSVSDLIDKIEQSISFIKEGHTEWNNNNEHYLSKLQQEAEKLKNSETEIKKYLTDISSYKNKYIANKDIIEKHFVSNKDITESIPNLNESISDHLGKISDEISVLDSKIKGFLEVNQKITDEVSKNPFLVD